MKLTDIQIEEVCGMYENGNSSFKIGKKFDVSKTTILNYLKGRKIKSRNYSSSRRTKTLDELVFDHLNEESEYWMGFILSDGCIYQAKHNSDRISIISKDLEHVEKFKHFLKSNHKVSVQSRPNVSTMYYGLYVKSNKLSAALQKYGIVPRKSLIAKALNGIDKSRHFWRGMVDGDGSIGEYFSNKRNKTYPSIQLVGSEDICNQFSIYCSKILNKKINVHKSKTIYGVGIGWAPAQKIISYLYSDSNIYLDRKYKKAMEIVGK